MRASAAYDTCVLSVLAGNDNPDDKACNDYLERLAARLSERDGNREGYCVPVPAEAFEGSEDPDITMYGTTSLSSFSDLLRNACIDAVVKVQYKYSSATQKSTQKSKVSHIVVVGPKFQLCTCLKLLRCGLHCSHVFAALVTKLDRASDFVGESIHPRWRTSVAEWSLRNAKLGAFDGHETFTGGYTEDFGPGAELADFGEDHHEDPLKTNVEYARKKGYADYVAESMKWASQASATLDGTPSSRQAFQAFLENQRVQFDAFMRGQGPEDGLRGLGNPPITLPKDKKETRHKDARGTEGSRKKKLKTEGSV